MPRLDPARYLSLDIGDKRIGVATGTSELQTVRPLEVLVRRGEDDHIFARLRELVKEEEAATVVVGDPVNMDGSVGPRAEISRAFAKRLKRALRQVRVVLYDERLSSFAADEAMERMGEKRSNRKKLRDAYAAAVILQEFFDGEAADVNLD